MKWYAEHKHPESCRFIIEEDETAGFYVYMYKDAASFSQDIKEGDTPCSRSDEDHLQDTLELAKKCALRVYGVPTDSWEELK